MIALKTYSRGRMYIATSAIATIREGSTSEQWHGIRSVVKTFDGETIECIDEASKLFEEINCEEGSK